MSTDNLALPLNTESDTDTLGTQIANSVSGGLIIYLIGELGAGKTRLAQAIIHGLGFQGHVKSPTYAMVESYPWSDGQIYHFDLYRLMDPMELEYMGIQDYFDSENIILIEWPTKGGAMIAEADISIQLEYSGTGRKATINAKSQRGALFFNKLKQNL